ncbi:MAG: hypothetical protein NVS2B16_02820 [Chloroflexota bacterium]
MIATAATLFQSDIRVISAQDPSLGLWPLAGKYEAQLLNKMWDDPTVAPQASAVGL